MRTRMQMIFQDPISSLNPRRKVGDIVAEALAIWAKPKTEHAVGAPPPSSAIARLRHVGPLRARWPWPSCSVAGRLHGRHQRTVGVLPGRRPSSSSARSMVVVGVWLFRGTACGLWTRASTDGRGQALAAFGVVLLVASSSVSAAASTGSPRSSRWCSSSSCYGAPGHQGRQGRLPRHRARRARTGRRGADQRRAGPRRRPSEAAARVLRWPVPAHLDRPGPGPRPEADHLRRAGVRARRLRAGPDPEPARGHEGRTG